MKCNRTPRLIALAPLLRATTARCLLAMVLSAMLGSSSLLLAQEPATEKPAVKPPALKIPTTKAELEALAAQLESNSFDARERATETLIATGLPAVEVVEEQLQAGSLEATTRALYILTQLALSADENVHEVARGALERTADADRGSVSRRAATAVANLNEQRREQTLEQLSKLSAKVIRRGEEDSHLMGFVLNGDAVEIGPEFTGDLSKDLRPLRWLSDVDRVVLVGDQITDQVLEQIAQMRGLRSLHLYATRVTDAGIAKLKSLDRLQLIGIYYSPVTDASVEHFAPLKALEGMKLYGTKISLDGVATIKAGRVIPLSVDHRAAFLGIGCNTIGETCVISTVSPDGPASRAGIQEDDVIVEFGGQPVASFESLTALISRRDVGEMVPIKIMRPIFADGMREKEVNLQVTLGKWDLSNCIRNAVRP